MARPDAVPASHDASCRVMPACHVFVSCCCGSYQRVRKMKERTQLHVSIDLRDPLPATADDIAEVECGYGYGHGHGYGYGYG